MWNIPIPGVNPDHNNQLFNIQMLFENLVSRSVGALSNWGPYPLSKVVGNKILEFGFNEKLVKRTYHGEAGVYTTDLFDKAFQFCKRHNGAVLICRVLLGTSAIRAEHTDR